MVSMDYQVILQYRIDFKDDFKDILQKYNCSNVDKCCEELKKRFTEINDRPKITKGWIPKSLDNKKVKEVTKNLTVSSTDVVEL